ncbi:MAG: ATP-dependent RecD-like DNA helicase [Candidatus Dojkabacteria bacterium]
MGIKLSKAQNQSLKLIADWYKASGQPYLTLGGYAGTGKTTLIATASNRFRKDVPKLKIAFCSYTGKAARILQQKLTEQKALHKGDSVSTIHRLIYSPVLDDDDNVIGWEKREIDKFPYRLIVVDEASMVNRAIWNDLLSFKVPVLAVGDHGQLPPIEGKFNLMSKPHIKLEEIYRQEKDNPIIQLSQLARTTGEIPVGNFGKEVMKLPKGDSETGEYLTDLIMSYDQETMILVGYNNTRTRLNSYVRQQLEFESPQPQVGDRVICLRNNYKKHIYNGMTGILRTIEYVNDENGEYYNAVIDLDDEDQSFRGKISVEQFGRKSTLRDEKRLGIDLFDFSYALTVHKAQGSQARRVIVFEERFPKMSDIDWRRWLYTAVTRATDELYIIGS